MLAAWPTSAALLAAWLVVACLAVTSAGCAATPKPATPKPAPSPTGAGAPAAAWTLPDAELGTQRLYRVTYDGPEEDGSFRLTLLLDTPERYQVRTVDPLGRALWTLDVAGEHGLWTDHRNRLWCPLEGAFDLAAARLAPFPLASLPALLVGRLPSPPAAAADAELDANPDDGRLAYRDDRGRRWSARLEGGLPVAWSLYEAAGGGEPSAAGPALTWTREGDEAYLSDRLRGTQLRWRQTLREALPAPLPAPAGGGAPGEPPAGYERADCATAYAG